MTKKIQADRVAFALQNIAEWRNNAKSQGATHLFPLLALIERGAARNPGDQVLLNETPHEFEFWDRYFRLNDGNAEKPYFNPITLRRAEAGFPHSNSATIRKNTFAGKWQAATRSDDATGEKWSLADNYADIFRDKVLNRSGKISRIPVLDVAILMFRKNDFEDGADARSVESLFRSTFPQRDADFEKMFEFAPEDEHRIFADNKDNQDYEDAIKSVLLDDVQKSSTLPHTPVFPAKMDVEDPILIQVQQLLNLGTSGIILSGVPGTGKSYYADRIASHLTTDPLSDIFRVQLHPSYGYEDFVEGYRPDEESRSGYKIVPKTFLQACDRAIALAPEEGFAVVVIDEINRGDPARVLGELLTYIERPYRNKKFTLPFSGKLYAIPENLFIIGTMNPYDRSVSQVDAAFVRRFDHIEMTPSREVAETLLEMSGNFSEAQISEIGKWFDSVQQMVPFGLGHSFFSEVSGLEQLRLVWKYRMRPAALQAIELNDGAIENLTASFDALMRRLEGKVADG